MEAIHVELSPGTEVKCRPLVASSRTENAEYFHRASRDAYYYDDHHSSNQDIHASRSPLLQATRASAEAMLEVELDAILRGETAARHRSADQKTPDQRAKLEPFLHPPPPLSLLPSLRPSMEDAVERSTTAQPRAKSGSPVAQADCGFRRRCAMQRSIDRFLTASEDCDGDAAGRKSRTLASSLRGAEAASITSSSPRVSPTPTKEREGGAIELTRTSSALSRVLFDTTHRSAIKCPRPVSEAENRLSRLANSPDAVAPVNGRKPYVLQNISVNATSAPLTSKAKQLALRQPAKDSLQPTSPVAAGAQLQLDGTPTGQRSCRTGKEQLLLGGAEMLVTCDNCQVSLRLFVFYAAHGKPCILFCPLCGCRTASTPE